MTAAIDIAPEHLAQVMAILARLADAFEDSSLPWRVDLVDYHVLSPAFREAVEADFVQLR